MRLHRADPVSQRGALACMEFTGNIFGYASSVVRKLARVLLYIADMWTVAGLRLLVHRLELILARTAIHSGCHWDHPGPGFPCHA